MGTVLHKLDYTGYNVLLLPKKVEKKIKALFERA